MPRHAVCILLATLVCLQACVASDPGREGSIANAELHGLMSTRMDLQLGQIEALALEQQLTEPERDAERLRRSTLIANAARELQQSVLRLRALQPELGLSPEQETTFGGLADTLLTQGAELEVLARNQRYDALPAALARAKGVCNACHALYRDN